MTENKSQQTNLLCMNLETIEQKVKDFINKIRIPRLLSFFIYKDGKINPTKEEALNEAPTTNNWERLGLGKRVFGLPRWTIILFLLIVVIIKWSSLSLQFFIEIISQGIILVPFGVVLYFILKSL